MSETFGDAVRPFSEGLTLSVLCGADCTVAVQRDRVVVKRGDVRLAARQPGSHIAGTTVCTHAVVSVDVGWVWNWFLHGHTQRSAQMED